MARFGGVPHAATRPGPPGRAGAGPDAGARTACRIHLTLEYSDGRATYSPHYADDASAFLT